MLEDGTFFITEVSISDSGLQQVAGALADHGGAGGGAPGQRGWLRSWVTGWTHRLEVDPLGLPQPEPIAGVGRLAEAVVDVLLERRPLEQMRRWLSRDVAGLLMPQGPGVPGTLSGSGTPSTLSGSGGPGGQHAAGGSGVTRSNGFGSAADGVSPNASAKAGPGASTGASVSAGPGAGAGPGPFGAQVSGERRAPRFASRSMIRSVRLHQPAAGIVESTVVVQDGTRVRAVALRFEQTTPTTTGRHARPVGFDWLCTALQFN